MAFPFLAVVSPPTHSQKVADAQWLLTHNVFKAQFYSSKVDSVYGPLTAAATYRAKYRLGYPKPDHVFGPRLYAYLKGDKKTPLAFRAIAKVRAKLKPKVAKGQKALAEARTFLGYRETYGNHTLFGKWYKLDANPWCGMFVSFCVDKVGGKFHYCFVPTVVQHAHEGRGGLFITTHPEPGDAVCFDWGSDGEYDHIGFFEKWLDEERGKFQTIEGNTLPPGGAGNQSNGGGVYERERGTQDGYRVVFVRWS